MSRAQKLYETRSERRTESGETEQEQSVARRAESGENGSFSLSALFLRSVLYFPPGFSLFENGTIRGIPRHRRGRVVKIFYSGERIRVQASIASILNSLEDLLSWLNKTVTPGSYFETDKPVFILFIDLGLGLTCIFYDHFRQIAGNTDKDNTLKFREAAFRIFKLSIFKFLIK